MNRGIALVGGLGLGAGLVYLLDPQMGRRRRALLRDRLVRLGGEAGDAARVAARDLGHRAQGLLAQTRSLAGGEEVDDRTLEERVRSKLGRHVTHPGSIEATARDGRVTLS